QDSRLAARWRMSLASRRKAHRVEAVPRQRLRALPAAGRILRRQSFAPIAAARWRVLRFPASNAVQSCVKARRSVRNAEPPRKKPSVPTVKPNSRREQSFVLNAAQKLKGKKFTPLGVSHA